MVKFLLKNSLLFAISWTVIIFILCYTPGRFIPTTNWLELLSFDKFVHAGIFFTLTCLWLIFWFKSHKLSTALIIFTLLGCIAYGGLLEIMQATLFSQRSGDWMDFIANSIGCFIGLWFFNKQKIRLTL
jgi:hypothetical protein